MNDRKKALWIGIFIMTALALFAWLVLFIRPSMGDGKVTLKVLFTNIERIAVGTQVTFAGKPVGEVTAIREIPDSRTASFDAAGNLYIYELTLKVDSCVKVYTYDEIILSSAGLLGEKSIAIIPKAAPPGAPPAQNVTREILYAHSTDKIEQTLNQLNRVAATFGDTLVEVNTFIEHNKADFNVALKNFTSAAQEMRAFMSHANETNMVGRATDALARAETFFSSIQNHELIEHLSYISGQIAYGEGSMGRLVNSECLYVSLTTVLCQLQTILEDIRQFGLLYQFDRKWQRMHDAQRCFK